MEKNSMGRSTHSINGKEHQVMYKPVPGGNEKDTIIEQRNNSEDTKPSMFG